MKGEEELKRHIASYYQNLFTSSGGQEQNELLRHVRTAVTSEMNEYLLSRWNAGCVFQEILGFCGPKSAGGSA